jgi:hypothetical protein
VLPVRDGSWPYIGQSQLVGGLAVAGVAATGVSQVTTATIGTAARSQRFARGHRTARQRVRWRPVPVDMSRLMASPQREVDVCPSIRRRPADTSRPDRVLTTLNRRS